MSARDKLIEIVTSSPEWSGGDVVWSTSLIDAHRAEVLTEVTTWLVKKAREFHARSRKREREQGDTCAVLASKIARGAVRPDNLRMLPNPGFFEVDRTYQRDGLPVDGGEKWTFKVVAVALDPYDRLTAFGFAHLDDYPWMDFAQDADSWARDGWTDVTDAAKAVSRG